MSMFKKICVLMGGTSNEREVSLVSGKNVAEAMGTAFCEMPSEIVGLMLSLTEPDGIAWSRFNMPMNVAFASHGAYLASAAIAMPEDAGEPMPLMPCAYGMVYADHWTTYRYQNSPLTVAQLTAQVRGRAFGVICQELAGGPKYYVELHRKVKELFESADCMPSTLATYEVLYALKKAGKLKVLCKNPAFAQELTMFKSQLLKKIQTYANPLGIEVNDIIFSYKDWANAVEKFQEIEDEFLPFLTDEELNSQEISENDIKTIFESIEKLDFMPPKTKEKYFSDIVKNLKYQKYKKGNN